jgi:chitinase
MAFFPNCVDNFRDVQLLLGLPLYGYVSQSTKQVLTGSLLPSSDMVLLQQSEVTSAEGTSDVHFLNGVHARTKEHHKEVAATAKNANLTSWYGQQIPFSEIVKSGALVKVSDGTYNAAGGFMKGEWSLIY